MPAAPAKISSACCDRPTMFETSSAISMTPIGLPAKLSSGAAVTASYFSPLRTSRAASGADIAAFRSSAVSSDLLGIVPATVANLPSAKA
jgi:hypothetical protein